MDKNEARQKFLLECARHHITDQAEVEATMQKILGTMPPAVKAANPDKSDEELALEMADAYFKTLGQGTVEANPADKRQTRPSDIHTTAEDVAAIQEYLDANAVATGQRTALTRVTGVITGEPILARRVIQGVRLTPTLTEKTNANFDKWEKELVDTPENRQAFAEMKEAFMKKEPMEIYVNPDAKEKVLGYKIATTDDKNEPVSLNLTKDAAIAFLLTKVQGFIPPRGDESVGIRIRWTKAKNASSGNNESGASSTGTTSVTLLNRKALQNNPEISVCSSVIAEVNGEKKVRHDYGVKTAKYFKIKTDKKKKDGTLQERKVRLSGKADVYDIVRLPEFVPDFGAIGGTKGGSMSKSERKKLNEAVINAFSNMQSSSVENNDLRTALSAIRRNKSSMPAGGFN